MISASFTLTRKGKVRRSLGVGALGMTRLGPPMSIQVRLLAKATSTLPADIRLLPRMGPLMPDEGRLKAEAAPTFIANAGLFSRVCPSVRDKV